MIDRTACEPCGCRVDTPTGTVTGYCEVHAPPVSRRRRITDEERDALVLRISPMMDVLTPDDWRAVFGNVFECAVAHPDERTSKAFFGQIEAHANGRRKATR